MFRFQLSLICLALVLGCLARELPKDVANWSVKSPDHCYPIKHVDDCLPCGDRYVQPANCFVDLSCSYNIFNDADCTELSSRKIAAAPGTCDSFEEDNWHYEDCVVLAQAKDILGAYELETAIWSINSTKDVHMWHIPSAEGPAVVQTLANNAAKIIGNIGSFMASTEFDDSPRLYFIRFLSETRYATSLGYCEVDQWCTLGDFSVHLTFELTTMEKTGGFIGFNETDFMAIESDKNDALINVHAGDYSEYLSVDDTWDIKPYSIYTDIGYEGNGKFDDNLPPVVKYSDMEFFPNDIYNDDEMLGGLAYRVDQLNGTDFAYDYTECQKNGDGEYLCPLFHHFSLSSLRPGCFHSFSLSSSRFPFLHSFSLSSIRRPFRHSFSLSSSRFPFLHSFSLSSIRRPFRHSFSLSSSRFPFLHSFSLSSIRRPFGHSLSFSFSGSRFPFQHSFSLSSIRRRPFHHLSTSIFGLSLSLSSRIPFDQQYKKGSKSADDLSFSLF